MIEKNKTRELVDIPRDRKVHQMDVKSTFLNGFLEEEIYVEQPKGFIVEEKEDKVYKLSKVIYGLKEVPRTWYNRINDYLISLGFDKSLLESAPYVKSKGVEWRLSKARMKEKINCKFVYQVTSSQQIGICSSKNQGVMLEIVFFNCK